MQALVEQRITKQHLDRRAVVYVRQSSPDQVRNFTESRRVQVGLRDRAISFGWKDPMVIEDDLGLSAGGYTERPGFQQMLAQVAMRAVGIILCIDASRLSRNSKDWANLFELCGYFETLIADIDQVYDLSFPNDRLVLGIKGTVSELELSILRTRLKLGAESKAARGKLKFVVPPGYAHDHEGQVVIDPDRRVQKAIGTLFEQYERCSSVRQLGLWYRDTKTPFPTRKLGTPCTTAWQVPSTETLRKLLKHPIYAGAYTYGRSRDRIECIDGHLVKKREVDLPLEQWRVCIHEHHAAYISWERYLANQDKMAASRPRWTMQDNLGPLRDGLALLQGLLRCGHCGKRIHVAYKTTPVSAMYYCDGKIAKDGGRRCLSFGSQTVDGAIGQLLREALAPHAIAAAQLAHDQRNHEHRQAVQQAALGVEAAQYAADRAFEQFDLVDPKNRLVADTLEQRLNDKLVELRAAKDRLEQMQAAEEPLSDVQLRQLEELAFDLPRVWDHPRADVPLKKRLLRAAIFEIVATHLPNSQQLQLVVHWQGGAHTQIHVKKRVTPVGSKTDPSLIQLITDLAAQNLSDAEITRILNMKDTPTPRGERWSHDRVAAFRKTHRITLTSSPDERYLTGQQVAAQLGISRHGVEGLLRLGALHNHQTIDFAPWRILRSELDSPQVKKLLRHLKQTGRLPRQGGCPERQLSLTPED